jgi:hypothetical protein
VVECLLSKGEALNSNPSTAKKRKKKRRLGNTKEREGRRSWEELQGNPRGRERGILGKVRS